VTSDNELNLLIAKNTLLEIYKVAAEGLKFAKQISIWGIIESLKIIRPKVNIFNL
jgi:DNA damage-binding protein 1